MPSAEPVPTIASLVKASRDALTGERDRYGDKHTGSLYDHASGPVAVLLSREADADRDNFRAIYFDDADGDDLTTLVQGRYPGVAGIARILDTYGVGTATFSRSSAAAGGGTFWTGTRIQVGSGAVYQVSTDTIVLAAQTTATIPIQATVTGPGVAGSFQSSGAVVLDPLYDPLWLPQSLTCADGTSYEDAKSYRARVRALLLNGRNGYLPEMLSVVQAAGAKYLVAFPSNYGLPVDVFVDADAAPGLADYGLNAAYVADANFGSSAVMVNAAAVALESARVLGADLWVGGIQTVPLAISVLVNLVDDPSKVDTVPVTRAIAQALLAQFSGLSSGYTYKRAGLAGAIAAVHGAVQTASIPAAWQAATSYGVGATAFASPVNGQVYQCLQSGTSGASPPAFPTIVGAIVPDGGCVWQCTAYPTLGITAVGVLQAADPTLSPSSWPATLSRYTLAPQAISIVYAPPI